ncbi:hypothetical protein E2C01_074016 [Portunus trituberculatus]|uniref:Uncharacterized protein n=1 Tax=Portunus trituberculatus TaxID=210409 RepID=A0A5B7IF82_PORTR|nr:hypothetical protein [Portunus trituberculatus]
MGQVGRGRSNVSNRGVGETQKTSGRVEVIRQVATCLSALFSQSSPSTLQTPWRRQGFLAEGARLEYDWVPPQASSSGEQHPCGTSP